MIDFNKIRRMTFVRVVLIHRKASGLSEGVPANMYEIAMSSHFITQRIRAIVLAMLASLVVFAPSVVQADPYPWCAVLGNGMDGARDCGYFTIEQCRATISGIGGDCEPNQFYTGPERKPAKRKRRRH
jgi:hypothetical protein